MKTGLDWFVEELTKQGMFMNLFKEEIKQAKEMEKEQIIKACDAGFDTANLFIEDMKYNSAEEYYKQTYGGNK
jgi:hypothetical protein